MGNQSSSAQDKGVLTQQQQKYQSNQKVGQQKQQEASSCPVPENLRKKYVYNVYGQQIKEQETQSEDSSVFQFLSNMNSLNSQNNMPIAPNQLPTSGQQQPLSTQRQTSTIPKGNTNSNWVYPSQQMFFNALQRKGKTEDVQEENMGAVVYQHNNLNEKTWQEVKTWESLHKENTDCQLLKFEGKYFQTSPLARFKQLLGYQAPFDRHDWYIERGDKTVRYVIDFYFDESKAGQLEAYDIVARPALDDIENCIDRAKYNIYTTFAYYGLPCPITGHQSSENFKQNNNQNSSIT